MNEQQVRKRPGRAAWWWVTMASLAVAGCGRAVPVSEPDSTSAAPASSHSTSPETSEGSADMSEQVVRSEEQWKKILTVEQYQVLRLKGTEMPYSNQYDRHFEPGEYACAACGQVLFSSETKFNSGCGWPAFYAARAEDRVVLTPDDSHGMIRTEVTCARCGSHLGHIFDDAPQTPTGQRYCINSVSLTFKPKADE